MMLLALLLALLLLIVIGVPIVLCMGVVGLVGMTILPGVNPALFPQRMFAMLDNYAKGGDVAFALVHTNPSTEIDYTELKDVLNHSDHVDFGDFLHG